MTNGTSLFPEAHDVVPALMIPAGDANQHLHHIVVERAQSLSCRCPLIVEVTAMTSTTMIVLITVPQDAPPVLLNLLILRPGANQVGLHSNYVDPYGHPVLNTDHSTWQDWDAWGKWGAQSPPDSHRTWHDQQDTHILSRQADPPRRAARLSAAPQSRSKSLTAFSSSYYGPPGKRAKQAKSSRHRSQSDQAHHSWSTSSIPKGHIKVSLKDDTQRDWVKKVRFALNSKQRMKAACELTDAEKPQPCIAIDEDKFQAVYHSIRALDRVIPGDVAHLATHLISGSRLLDDIEVSKAHVLDLRTTNMMALVFPLPDISRFSMPEPFKGKQYTTWASIHGTPAEGAQNILLEGFMRPAN